MDKWGDLKNHPEEWQRFCTMVFHVTWGSHLSHLREDVISAGVLGIAENYTRCNGHPARYRAFFFACAKNRMVDFLRGSYGFYTKTGKERQQSISLTDATKNNLHTRYLYRRLRLDQKQKIENALLEDEKKTIVEAIRRTGRRCDEALALYLLGYETAEISSQLGMNYNSVSSMVKYAKDKLISDRTKRIPDFSNKSSERALQKV